MSESIRAKAKDIREIINRLFNMKEIFYGDFLYSKELGKVPDPINHINDAIMSLECAENEAYQIKLNEE